MTRVIQQLPQNSTSATTAEVYTATGFNQGDLVYYQNGDYKSQANLTAPSSVSYPSLAPSTIFGGGVGGYVNSIFTSTTSANTFGSSRGSMAALLSNGNIVQVFRSYPNNYATFRVVNSSNVVQVSPVNITTPAIVGAAEVGVLALSGGGFVIYWLTSTSGSIAYAIYSNTGVVVTATTTEVTGGTATNTSVRMRGVALANGGFVLCFTNTTSVLWFKVYTSTGGATTSWASSGITTISSYTQPCFAIAARSDSSFAFAWMDGTYIYISRFTSAGVSTGGNVQITGVVATTIMAVDIACLSDGSTYVVAGMVPPNVTGATSYWTPCFTLFPSSNTQGTLFYFPYQNQYQPNSATNYTRTLKIAPTSAGGFAVFSGDYSGAGYYAFFNSSGTCLSGVNGTQIVPVYVPAANFYDSANTYGINPSIVEYGGYLNVFYQATSGTAQLLNQHYFQISTSTYQPVAFASTSSTVATASSTAGTQVALSGTPSAVKYNASASESLPVVVGLSSSLSSTVISNIDCYSFHACTLPNGNFIVVYGQAVAPYSIFANVYSPIGALITSFFVASGGSANLAQSANSYQVRVCALPSGKFVITYPQGNSTVSIVSTVYSSSYRPQASVTNTTNDFASSQSQYSCIGLTGDNFVVTYCDASNYPTFAIYNSSGTLLQGPTNFTATGSYYGHTPYSFENGGWGVRMFTNNINYQYYQSGATTWSNTANPAPGSTGTVAPNFAVCAINNGLTCYMYASASTTAATIVGYASNTSTTVINAYNPTTFAYNFGTPEAGAMGPMANGGFLLARVGTRVANNTPVTFSSWNYQANGATSWGTDYQYPSSNQITVKMSLDQNVNMIIIPNTAFNNVLVYKNYAKQVVFSFFNGLPYNYVINTTSGSTNSTYTPITPNTLAQNAVTNTILVGVAATTAAAGSTGQVVINGQAVLNSNYPATLSSQGFDFQGQTTLGVKGTILNRNVNLQGNS
jgi:hypothetical protein